MGTRIWRPNTPSLVIEDAAKMVSIGEDIRLVGEICASRVDKIDAGEA